MIHLDLFSGIGGFSLGLKKVFNIEHTYYSEIDKYAIDVYKHNFKNSTYVGSITDVRGTQLPRINIITFGSPCQDFSLAGKRKGMDGERSSLILEAIRLIKECKPDFFIWENVKGTFSSNSGADFTAILKAFVDIGGYRLEWQLLNTKWFLPQNRERIYLVGCLGKGSGQQIFPITKNSKQINELQGQQANTCTLTTRYEAGGNGSYIIKRELNAQKVIKPTQLGQSTQTYAYKNGTIIGKENQDAFTIRSSNPNGVMMKIKSATKKGIVGKKLNDNQQKKLDKLKVDPSISGTLTEAIGRGGSSGEYLSMLKKNQINTGSIRRLTPIECERLQGFPDDWTKTGEELGTISDTQRYKMCGNAVTVDVVEAVAKKIFLTLYT
jgi:DNA (cytosine-5)-methyltransferase 1